MYCGPQWPPVDTAHNLLRLGMATDGHGSQSIVANNIYRWTMLPDPMVGQQPIAVFLETYCLDNVIYEVLFTIYCGRQWLSMDTSHKLLQPAMATDRHGPQSIVAGNGHGWTRFTIYCSRQWLSMDTVQNPLWSTMAIDGHGSQTIEVDNVYRLTVSPVHCHDNRLLRPSFQTYCRRQHLSIDNFHSPLWPTIYIDRFLPSSIVVAIYHCCSIIVQGVKDSRS